MDLQSRLRSNHRSDLLDGNVVFESKCEQELIAKAQLCDSGCEGLSPFGAQQFGVGMKRALIFQPIDVDLVGDEIHQVSTGGVGNRIGPRGLVTCLWTPVLAPMVVDAETTRHHDEPGGELPPARGGKSAETPEVVLLKLF